MSPVRCPISRRPLWEDGYGDLYGVLKQLIVCGFQGYLSIDHAFQGYASTGGSLGSMAYPTGYLKGMLHARSGSWQAARGGNKRAERPEKRGGHAGRIPRALRIAIDAVNRCNPNRCRTF